MIDTGLSYQSNFEPQCSVFQQNQFRRQIVYSLKITQLLLLSLSELLMPIYELHNTEEMTEYSMQ